MRIRSIWLLPLTFLCCLALPGPVRAAGTGDLDYHALFSLPQPVGVLVDWRVMLLSVSKVFYTYTMTARVEPDPGQHCNDCVVTVIDRNRPLDLARPPAFRAGQVVALRGQVLRLRPQVTILAFSVQPQHEAEPKAP